MEPANLIEFAIIGAVAIRCITTLGLRVKFRRGASRQERPGWKRAAKAVKYAARCTNEPLLKLRDGESLFR
jgi:hypothetical protein